MTSLSWIPSEAIEGAQRLCLRLRHHPLRPAAALRGPRPRGPARGRPLPLRQRAAGVDRSRCGGTRHRLRLRRRRAHGVDDGQRGRAPAQVRGGAAARPPTRARVRRRVGALRADHRWPDRPAGTAAGAAAALHPVAGAARLDDALAHLARRRSGRAGTRSGRAASPGTGSTTRREPSRTSRGSPTSRTGTASRSAGTRPWGDQDSEALVTAVETALERSLSARVMGGSGKVKIKRFPAGAILAQAG